MYEALFSEHLPSLFQHFQAEGVESEMYMLDWLLTLYSRSMPLNVAARIWDCYLLEGELFLYVNCLVVTEGLLLRTYNAND